MFRFVPVLILFFYTQAFGSGEMPITFNLSGKLYSSTTGTTALEEIGVEVRVQILNSTKTCILYEELQTVNTDTSGGRFSIEVGSLTGPGKRVVGSDPGNTMATVFQNLTSIPATCAGSSAPAVARSGRYIRVSVKPPAGSEEVLSPDMFMGHAPTALVAETLGGLTKDQFLQLGTTSNLTQANLETVFSSSNYPILSSIISGNSPAGGVSSNGNYVITANADNTGSDSIQFFIASGKKAEVTSAGDFVATQKIGIGTGSTAPTHDLSLGSTSDKSIGLERSVGTGGRNLAIYAGDAGALQSNSGGGDLYLSSGVSTGNAGSNIIFRTPTPGASGTGDNSVVAKMILNSLGYLGVGTLAPLRPIHVSSATSPGILLENSSSAADARKRYLTTTLSGDMAFGKYTDDMVTTTEHARILSNGNMGIGVANPGATLELKAGTSTIAPLKLSSGTNLLSPVDGTLEFDGTKLTFTIGGVRMNLAGTGSSTLASTNFGAGTSAAVPGFTVTGDSDTGIFSPAANTLSFSAGGVEALRLNNTASAVNFLSLSPAASGSGPVIAAEGSDANINLTFTPKGTGASIFNGRVGIGTSSPLQKLHISSNEVAGAGLRLESTDTGGRGYTIRSTGSGSSGGAGNLKFVDNGAGLDRLTLTSAGRVGIGTTNPDSDLHVVGSLNSYMRVSTSAALNTPNSEASLIFEAVPGISVQGMANSINRGINGTVAGDYFTNNRTGGKLIYSTATLGDRVDMTIDAAGSVGVGTLTPSAKLHVVPAPNAVGILIQPPTLGSGEQSSIRFADPDGGVGPMDIVYQDGSHPVLSVMGGNFGINTTNPGSTLEVNGSAKISGQTTFGGDITSDSLIQSNGILRANNATQSQLLIFQSQVIPQVDLNALYGLIFLPTLTQSTHNVSVMNGIFSRVDLAPTYSGTVGTYNGILSSDPIVSGGGILNVRGITSEISAGANRHNLYISGTASNFFAGNVGIGYQQPEVALRVEGAIVGRSVANSSTSINFATANNHYTSSSCGSFILTNMKNGGEYQLAVQGTALGTCSFDAYSDSGSTPLTVHLPPNHGSTTNGTHTLYSFVVMGTHLYVAWTPGY